MTTQLIPAAQARSHTVVARPAPDARSRAVAEPTLRTTIRVAVLTLLLALGLCGMVATAAGIAAGTNPPEGPAPGLDG
jgi:hypothetical protein